MKRVSAAATILLLVLTASACGDEDDPAAAATGEPTSSASASDAADAPTGQVGCLVSGSPWRLSNGDLESQIPATMSGINVTDTKVEGTQTLTVTDDLVATFVADATITIAAQSSQDIEIRIVQTQRGTASGTWSLAGDVLTPAEHWTGGINGTTKSYVNGTAGAATPFSGPAADYDEIPMTFSCDEGALMMHTPKSPFNYLWLPSR
ncbi:hypothetical protein [Aeromicrobium panaciterrae]|uniref:hypothetical protein n=1 Tax=Aeromicrobium panaciterrae TaxID=363861 RepID=UPI0031CE88E0